MDIFNKVVTVLTTLVTVFTFYQIVYLVVGLFAKTQKFAKSEKQFNYGVIICARNEEKVIGKLIESIRAQTYDSSKITIFVCADSCTDSTAQICRDMGCIVYERFNTDPNKARKGYALEFAFDNIERDYGISSFDGFSFFDADNVLAPNWFEKMNDAFATGSGIVTTYRNTKNFDQNFVSAAYGIHFYRSTLKFHRARQLIRTTTHIAGTGYTVNTRLLQGGWKCFELTEDTEFTIRKVSEGEKIIFCEEAQFFDEQPHSLKVMFRQRLRWAKGRLFVFLRQGWKCFKGIFANRGVRKRWSCYDIFWYTFPGGLFTAFLSGALAVAGVIAGIAAGSTLLEAIPYDSAIAVLRKIGVSFASTYVYYTVLAAASVIRENKNIHCSAGKKILYIFTFFWFDLTNMPISIISLFMRIRWKPIVHDASIDYNQIIANGNKACPEEDTQTEVSEEKSKSGIAS